MNTILDKIRTNFLTNFKKKITKNKLNIVKKI